MNLIKILFLVTLIVQSFLMIGQISRGDLLMNQIPSSIDSFFIDSQIDLTRLRATTNFLTNTDIVTYNGNQIPKRRKAFIRHVKHISEMLECSFVNREQRTQEISELIYELYLLEASLKQKTYSKSITKVSFKDKFQMVIAMVKSKRLFTYRIPDYSQLEIDSIFKDPENSPYFHQVDTSLAMHKRFGSLAGQKKIKAKKNMVVLFKSLSNGGSAPKINTLDLDLDSQWSLKWGDEVHTDVLGSRIFAALGFDVDHPYYYGKNDLTLVFEDYASVNSPEELQKALYAYYEVDITPFISNVGVVTSEMAKENKKLLSFVGKEYMQFIKCSIEARPDRVKRIGSFLPHDSINVDRKPLKGAVLAHHFIGNWDTREANTLMTTVHSGNYNYRISAVFSDLGTSFGVDLNSIPPDFKVGLVNELPWEAVKRKKNKIVFTNRINGLLPFYKNATYADLLWMATKIAVIDEYNLRKMIKKAHWPSPISELYFHKIASRRASILEAFNLVDPNPITFDQQINISYKGNVVVRKGKLIVDFELEMNPESFTKKKGRRRNYGH